MTSVASKSVACKLKPKIVLTYLLYSQIMHKLLIVKIEEYGLSFFFIFFLYFIFLSIYFYFSIFRTLGLGLEVICHTVTPVTSDDMVTTLIIGLKRKK